MFQLHTQEHSQLCIMENYIIKMWLFLLQMTMKGSDLLIFMQLALGHTVFFAHVHQELSLY
jgi:hypothetical protein